MGKKWGSNEDIRIGDVFECWDGPDMLQPDSDYYQVVALRGKTQVVLRPLQMETYINEGIAEDSPLHWRRERKRPLPGRFMTAEYLIAQVHYERGKEIRRTGEEVTAWVLPDRTIDGRPQLREVRWSAIYSLALPEDWEPWDTETIKQLEDEDLQARKELAQRWLGEQRGLELQNNTIHRKQVSV